MVENLTDNSTMPFGAHKGKKLEDVPADYLIWLEDNTDVRYRDRYPGLYGYILSIYDVLEEEVDNDR